jgi:hypothetical protein
MAVHVIYIILQVLGWTLAVISAVLLLLSAIILFSPVKYEARGSSSLLKFRLRWLFGFFKIDYADGKWRFKFFRFRRRRGHSYERSEKAGKPAEANKEKETTDDSERPISRSHGEEERPKRKLMIREKLKKWEWVADLFKTRKPLIKLLRRCARVLKPRVLRVQAVVGLENPADTGLLLGFLGILSGMWNVPLNVTGNFFEEILDYDIYIKDVFVLWSLFLPLVMFSLTKPGWAFIQKYLFKKKEEVQDEPAVKPNIRRASTEC